jgi:hypothetical protein
LTLGGGFEFETDADRSEFAFPFLAEYNLTQTLRAALEPALVYIDFKDANEASVGGWGDFETSLQWEFLRERRYRPALTLEGIVKWPTAAPSELGEPGRDDTLGLIASKDLVYAEVDLALHYTFVGDEAAPDNMELTLAGEWPVNHRLSVLMESVASIETTGGRADVECTAGLAWRVSSYLKLESGGAVRSDGTWQVLFAWEWNFAGED